MAMASAPLPSGSDVTHIEVCRKFLKGECPFRDCKFAHPERHVELTGDWVRVCLDHLQGKCNRCARAYVTAIVAGEVTVAVAVAVTVALAVCS